MWKMKKWHWNKKQEKAFSTLKKSLSENAHLVIFQSAYKKILETDALDFVIDTYLY